MSAKQYDFAYLVGSAKFFILHLAL